VRLHLLTHAATAASRQARFPADEPLDESGQRTASAVSLAAPDRLWCAPSRRCRETAALVLPGRAVDGEAPDGPASGGWAGRAPAELAAEDPAALQAWLTDPDGAPPGGESLAALLARVGGWMDGLDADDDRGAALAVVDPPVVRAAVAHALGAGPAGLWRVDAAPLTLAVLTGRAGRWNLRALGAASG
jgi:broad specificity phosphatase PhoE